MIRFLTRFMLTAALMGGAVSSVAGPATAHPGGHEDIYIKMETERPGATQGEGEFLATGVFEDAGRSAWRAHPRSDTTVNGDQRLQGAKGEIFIYWEGTYRFINRNTVRVDASWVVTPGCTGKYAGMRGTGRAVFWVKFSQDPWNEPGKVRGVYTGRVHLAH